MPTDRTRVPPPPPDGPEEVPIQGGRLEFGRHYPCRSCKGRGVKFDSGKEKECYRCKGIGYLTTNEGDE